MYKLKRIIVALDLTEMDEVLLRYTSELAKKIKADKTYFYHIAEDFDIPSEIKEKYPDLLAPTDESLEAIIKEQIDKYWTVGDHCGVDVEVKEGNSFEKLVRAIDNKDADLIVMGRKKSLKGSGALSKKMANLAHSSVMLVPDDAKFDVGKLVVPIDYSKHSKLVVEQAINISKNTEAHIEFVHVFTVPSGYHKTGKSYDEFADIMKQHSEEDYQKFIKQFDFEDVPPCEHILDDDKRPSDKIFDYAEKNGANLIIMGSKGRTGLASMLLGSVATKVIDFDTSIPLLIVKEKKENMGFLKALLNI